MKKNQGKLLSEDDDEVSGVFVVPIGDRPQLGLIAQKVEKVFPGAVATDGNGVKSVAYSKLSAPSYRSGQGTQGEK